MKKERKERASERARVKNKEMKGVGNKEERKSAKGRRKGEWSKNGENKKNIRNNNKVRKRKEEEEKRKTD